MNKRKLLRDYLESIDEDTTKQVTYRVLEIQRESEMSNAEKVRRIKGVIENFSNNED